MPVYYVYVLECVNDSYYIGYTTDLARRYREHQQGSRKCKYTRAFAPKRLAVSWCVDGSLAQAMALERWLKALTRLEKTRLVASPQHLNTVYPPLLSDEKSLLIVHSSA